MTELKKQSFVEQLLVSVGSETSFGVKWKVETSECQLYEVKLKAETCKCRLYEVELKVETCKCQLYEAKLTLNLENVTFPCVFMHLLTANSGKVKFTR